MNKIKKFNLKKTLTLIAALGMVICLTFCVACGGDSDGSSSSSGKDDSDATVTVTDYQSIKNGDFEFGTSKEDVTYPVYTGINWTRYRDNSYPTSAVSSTKNSGIIDTEDEAYKKIAESNNFPKDGGDNYWNPKTPQSYGLGGDRYVYDEETFQDNPNEDKLCTKGSKILMIHNVTSVAGRGTAQKFVSSSSLTSETGYGKISVWVMTKDLKSIQQDQPYGAYISVNNTLSSTRSPFLLKNIDTKGVWAEYVIYLKTSDYAKSSFTVTVGLGFGSDTYKAEYVEGFAYFDDIHYEEMDKEAFETETADVEANNNYALFTQDGNEVEAEALKVSQEGQTYVENAQNVATTVKYVYSHLMEATAFTSEFNGDYNKVYQHDPDAYANGATAGYKAYSEVNINGVTNPYGENEKTAFIKLDSHSSYTLTSGTFAIANGEYKQFNFLTNVNVEVAGQPGAKIEVEEVSDASASEVYGTVSVATDYNTYSAEDNANVWKKVSVFVKNDLGTTRYIRFKLTLGTTDNVFDAAEYHLTRGYALFTGFTERSLPEKEYNIVSSQADYKSTITLGYEYPNGPSDDEDDEDDFAFTATGSTKYDLETKPATGVSGYTGVIGNHTMVGGDKNEYTAQSVISGIVSGKYVSNYDSLTDEEKQAVLDLSDGNIQPLIIKNTAMNSYGYLGTQLTFAANTTNLVTVQVKVLGDAQAYVYLANADPLSYFGVLQVADKPMEVAINSSARPDDAGKWVTVNFLVTTGDEEITYRVELWNGSRDGNVQSQGTVLFNNVTTSESANATELKAKLDADFVASDADLETKTYTRAPSTVTYTDADGKEVTYERTYEPTVAYTKYLKGSSIIASYEAIHAPTTIDETTATDDDGSSDDSSSTEEVNPEAANWGLQLASIIIAAVLVIVLIVVVIRIVVKKNKKVEVAANNYYNRNSREQAQAIINANKAKRAQKAAEEAAKTEETAQEEPAETENNETSAEETETANEEKPYDYDNPENNL